MRRIPPSPPTSLLYFECDLKEDAVYVVRFLLEHQDITQRDLIPEFGSESAVSMFLARQRKLTVERQDSRSACHKVIGSGPDEIFRNHRRHFDPTRRITLSSAVTGH
jgi:hypothetical protein